MIFGMRTICVPSWHGETDFIADDMSAFHHGSADLDVKVRKILV